MPIYILFALASWSCAPMPCTCDQAKTPSCGDTSQQDTATPETNSADTSIVDTSHEDTATPDSSSADTSPEDTGTPDTGESCEERGFGWGQLKEQSEPVYLSVGSAYSMSTDLEGEVWGCSAACPGTTWLVGYKEDGVWVEGDIQLTNDIGPTIYVTEAGEATCTWYTSSGDWSLWIIGS